MGRVKFILEMLLSGLKLSNISNLNENGSKLIGEVHNAKLITELREPAWKIRIIHAAH